MREQHRPAMFSYVTRTWPCGPTARPLASPCPWGVGTLCGALTRPNRPRPGTMAPAAWTTPEGVLGKLTHTLPEPTAMNGWSAAGWVIGRPVGAMSVTFAKCRPPSVDTPTKTLKLAVMCDIHK